MFCDASCVRLSSVSLSLPQFIIEDMKQQQTNKHSNLHREDQHITVEELWKGWKTSEGKTQDKLSLPRRSPTQTHLLPDVTSF